jgi:cytochrome b pre-mRNA-processing protein 3
MPLSRLLRRSEAGETVVQRLYDAIVAQARLPEFYRRCAVPDTLDGRFDMIALHLFLVMRRLKSEGGAGRTLSQAVCERFFDDLDRSLREMGAGDLGVGRRVKAMAQAFYGRVAAYDVALNGDDVALAEALMRNLYGTVKPGGEAVTAMASYVRRASEALAAQGFAAVGAGKIEFGAPP